MEKELIELIKNIPKQHLPVVSLPKRDDDCPAAPICEAIGNLRNSCRKGGFGKDGPGGNVCMSSLILLVSRVAGMWPQGMVDQIEEKRKIGFQDSNQ